ncbi:MAG: hypothetical protein GY777_29655 [Candidatus Brocadiaceae bacterium]|nr:hypothetical protein [Candidatus Brocadiaceae bacterium]
MATNMAVENLKAFNFFGPFNPFEQKILLAFIEGLAIAIVVLLIGLVSNRIIERFKAHQAIKSEFNKIRVKKTIKVWEALYSLYRAMRKSSLDIIRRQPRIGESSDDDFEKFQKFLEENGRSVESDIKKLSDNIYGNRLWMTDESQRDAECYLSNLGRLNELFQEWRNDLLELKKQYKGGIYSEDYSKKSDDLRNKHQAETEPIYENIDRLEIDKINVESILKDLLRSAQ